MITEDKVEEIIESMNTPFDSHQVIMRASHRFQKEYIEQLHAAIDQRFPFQYVHSAIGRSIASVCKKRGYVGVTADTPDMFGQLSTCTRWDHPAEEHHAS